MELGQWAERYNQTLNRDDPRASGFPTPGEHLQFVEDGEKLALRLAKEVGSSCTVLYFNDMRGTVETVRSA